MLRQQGRRLKVVTGCFDPLIAAHARRLKALQDGGAALMIVVADPPRPILPARARAELVAGLSVVDFVALPGAGRLEELLEQPRRGGCCARGSDRSGAHPGADSSCSCAATGKLAPIAASSWSAWGPWGT